MLANPRRGQRVRLWYRAELRGIAPYHDRTGVVVVAGKGKPRNHGVLIDDEVVVVPCGHLVKA